jgi:hypothetical protein
MVIGMTGKTQSLLRTTLLFQACVAAAVLMLAASGCGSKAPHSDRPWKTVSVAVTSSGQPLTIGQVTLRASEGGTGVDAGGELDASGQARFPVLPGSYVAVIQPLPPPPEGLATDPGAAAAATGERSIPKRYRSPATSPLAVEIREGEKLTFAFDLTP